MEVNGAMPFGLGPEAELSREQAGEILFTVLDMALQCLYFSLQVLLKLKKILFQGNFAIENLLYFVMTL